MNVRLIHGDCIPEMDKLIEEGVRVDSVIADIPYGVSHCAWDTIIPLDKMWKRVNNLIKRHGAILLFSGEPFTSTLICSNLKGFKYRIDWDKVVPSGMGYAKYRPMQQTEDICVFTSKGEKSNYYPQMIKRDKPIKSGGNSVPTSVYAGFNDIKDGKPYDKTYEYKYPTTLIRFLKIRQGAIHPTQKPIELLEYLVKTYTQEGELVLDFTAGSFTTGIACQNLGRSFIGIEIDRHYFSIGVDRMEKNTEDKKCRNL